MDLAELMVEMASRLGLSGAEFEADGGGQIVIDDDLAIDIEALADDPGILITATVGPLPADAGVEVYSELLEANLQGQGTGGPALAVDREYEEIVLSRTILQTDLPFDVFERELVTFVNGLRAWRDRLKSGQLGQSEDTDGSVQNSGAIRI